MKFNGSKVSDLKIAYIGGGSRGWAWGLMSDLAKADDMSGTVYLYDIDTAAAKKNETIGNNIGKLYPEHGNFSYIAENDIDRALTGADFVIISIMPGTFDEMYSDVHAPEEYGIYQSVGDSTGLGGIIRGLRALPMFEEFAEAIKRSCPEAWVINYTNPMTMCVRMLYEVFPQIKAFGCCHEVFGTQKLLKKLAEDELGVESIERDEIKVEVTGVNHFTWLTKAQYRNVDLFPIYRKWAEKISSGEIEYKLPDDNWYNKNFKTGERVKTDLFLKYGAIAAAGDRHLAEFCPNNWYLGSPENVDKWGFALTSVDYRREELKERLARAERLASGEEKFEIAPTGEEGVNQIRAILGLKDLTTNVNIPNYGQIPNIKHGAVVEVNAAFTANRVTPLFTGNVPDGVLGLVTPIVQCQETVIRAVRSRDLGLAFTAFLSDPQNILGIEDSKRLFEKMVRNTSKYLGMYDMSTLPQ